MDTCSNNLCLDSNWQATSLGLMMNLRNILLSISENSMKIYPQVSKPLTRGAVYMIYVMLIFILLAVIGSTITIYEFLLDSCGRIAKPHEKYAGISRRSKNKVPKSTESSVDKAWLNGFKTFLSCFCLLKNGRKLINAASNKDQFECIHGIRCLNNFMIILLHICLGYMSTIRNVGELQPLVGMWSSQLVFNGQYSVDAFFVLSGFLNAYLFFKNYDKNNGNVSWPYFYLKRFIRLTPVYMVVLGFYTLLFPYVGSGPIWPTFDSNPVCSQNWWWNLLYINNFKNYTSQCMEWCWYHAADMQFYIISPIFLVSLMRNPKLGYILTGACIAASCLASFIITKQYNLVDGFSRMEYNFGDLNNFFARYWTYFDLVYTKPYTRISSYLVAILLAHYLYKRRFNKIKCSQIILLLGWIVTGILWFIAYFALFKREESIIENAVYNGIKHLFYSIGLSWIIFVCLTGQGGLVNKCLSWKVFYPLAKLSYCAYLIHPLVLMRYYQAAENLEDLNDSLLVLTACVNLWTYVFSFITSLLFEFPVLNLLDLVSTKKQTVKQLI